jgi:putative FmdB family regulatory protein
LKYGEFLMPIYEYQCTNCHHKFDLLQKITEEPATKCPECSKNTAVRLVSAAGFQLKGSGWYATDFKNKGTAKPETKNETKVAETPATSTKKGESD